MGWKVAAVSAHIVGFNLGEELEEQYMIAHRLCVYSKAALEE